MFHSIKTPILSHHQTNIKARRKKIGFCFDFSVAERTQKEEEMKCLSYVKPLVFSLKKKHVVQLDESGEPPDSSVFTRFSGFISGLIASRF